MPAKRAQSKKTLGMGAGPGGASYVGLSVKACLDAGDWDISGLFRVLFPRTSVQVQNLFKISLPPPSKKNALIIALLAIIG